MYINKDMLINELSNFYTDYGYDTESIKKIFDTYVSGAQLLEDYILQIKDNMNISSIETYRTFAYKVVSTEGATYDYEKILYDRVFVQKLSLSNKTLEERKSVWANLSNAEKIEILSLRGNYVELTAKRDIDLQEPSIVHLDVYDLKNRKLSQNSDFVLSQNKLFLINNAAYPTIYNTKLILKDIIVDYNTPQIYLGKNLGILYSDIITKPEYRDFVQMLVYASLGGPTIKNIKSALNTLAGWKNIDIVDMMSAKGIKKVLWESNSGESVLKPFDFMVSIPIEYFSSEGRISMFSEFLNIIKPAYTNYVIAWSQQVIDKLHDATDTLDMGISSSTQDTIAASDSVKTTSFQRDSYVIDMQQGQPVILEYDGDDVNLIWDNRLHYDLSGQLVTPEGAQGYGDICDVKHITFPEYPLQFTATRNITTGNVSISFKDNATGITRYEILRNGIIILTAIGTGEGSMLALSDTTLNNQPSGEYKYYARSVYEIDPNIPELTKYSPPSKIITIIR